MTAFGAYSSHVPPNHARQDFGSSGYHVIASITWLSNALPKSLGKPLVKCQYASAKLVIYTVQWRAWNGTVAYVRFSKTPVNNLASLNSIISGDKCSTASIGLLGHLWRISAVAVNLDVITRKDLRPFNSHARGLRKLRQEAAVNYFFAQLRLHAWELILVCKAKRCVQQLEVWDG
jgi:hypothetical protein